MRLVDLRQQLVGQGRLSDVKGVTILRQLLEGRCADDGACHKPSTSTPQKRYRRQRQPSLFGNGMALFNRLLRLALLHAHHPRGVLGRTFSPSRTCSQATLCRPRRYNSQKASHPPVESMEASLCRGGWVRKPQQVDLQTAGTGVKKN